ncbi:hypothetical protein [Nocardia flavorosea]|uniref:Tetratricopeptide repeat protein n=1 Tax=Nocardia flavorosea TaxID=53429 RepID=A0A846YG16_9NOCA|nr:hypothetical protein [Nocardia flavorosea]NKY57923.1 hypothetical protein [Nocardia flavorosea]
MHDPGSPGIGFVPSQADRSAPVSGAGQLPRYLRGGYRDATPLLTGAPRPSSGPRHSAEPAPQRRTLAARYRSADPIDLDGATVYPMYSEQLPTPASALTMTLLSATPPAGLAAVGIGLSVIDGYIDLDDRHLAGVDIWRDALERGITFDLAADSPDALFALTPVWSDAAGEPQSWSGNYGIVVERTEMGRTVLWCSMGEGPPHFADLVIEVRSTPLDPHPHLFMSGAIPAISTATPPEGRRNRHHWVEPDDPAPDDALELDPWAAHYEPAADDSPAIPAVDDPLARTTTAGPLTTPIDDSAPEPVTDEATTASTTHKSVPAAAAPESVPVPAAHESLAAPAAHGPAPVPIRADNLSAPTVSPPITGTFTTASTKDSVSARTTADPATSPTMSESATPPEPAPPPTEVDALPTPTVSVPTAYTFTTSPTIPAPTAAAPVPTAAVSPPVTYTFTSAPAGYDSRPTLTTASPAPSPTMTGTVPVPATSEPASAPTAAGALPPASAVCSFPVDHDPLPIPAAHDALPASTTHRSATAEGVADNAPPAVASADHLAESVVNDIAMAADAPGSVPESIEDDAEIQGYLCSFADIRLSVPAYEEGSADTPDLEATAPHRALIDDLTGYDDPLAGTGGGHHSPADVGEESYSDTGRHGWAENPELTGLVPVIRDAGFTDYGPEPPRPAATAATATTSLYRTPLFAGGEAVTEFAMREDHALVDTLADDSLAPVTPPSVSPTDMPTAEVTPPPDDDIDPARLHSLGAIAHAQGDDDRAHLLWTRAARAGSLGAIYDLGALSLRRDDPGAAERWWRTAAGRRMIPAMAELAVLLEQRGALAEARMWRTQAVAEEVIATANRQR